jgi:hypothetical protein
LTVCRFKKSRYSIPLKNCEQLLLCSRNILPEDPLLLILNSTERFLCSRGRLGAHLTRLFAANSAVILDVGIGAAWPPMPITKSVWMDLREGVEQLRNALADGERTERLEVTLPSAVNLATMFGLMLGFPVVYWSQPSQVPSSSFLETIVKFES